MLRSSIIPTLLLLAFPVVAHGQTSAPVARQADCAIRTSVVPTSWMIQGYDPYGGSLPEGTFSVTFTNVGGAECRFSPAFELAQPPFGLSKGSGRPVSYALLNLTESQDVTPRAGGTIRTPSQREIILAVNDSKTTLYKLVANPEDVRDAGTFTQNVTLEARDSSFRSFGGTRLMLGLEVLPSARIGLSGAYTMSNGQAVVNLGDLRSGVAPVPLQIMINSTGQYDLKVSSANSGQLRLGSTEWSVPYSVVIGKNSVNLAGITSVAGPNNSGYRRDSLPIQFIIGDVRGRRAGTYSDVLSISVTAR